VIGAQEIAATVTGGTFTIALGAGTIDLAGADVSIVATDAAQNVATIVQKVRADLTPPELLVEASVVHDEKLEVPTFDGGQIPIHPHTGPEIDLATGMGMACPVVTKFSYLLGATEPPYGQERDALNNLKRNPVAYTYVAGDTGVGIATNSTRFRVGRRDGSGTTVWLTPLTGAGPGTFAGAGLTRFVIGVVREVVPGLSTTEGIYDVELSTADRFGRTTTTARCFDLRLRAPPLNFEPPAVLGMPVPGAARNHPRALNPPATAPPAAPDGCPAPPTPCGLTLAPPGTIGAVAYDNVAARLLNDDAAASLLDQPFINGTAETVILSVEVVKPTQVTATRKFEIRNATSTQTVSLDCDLNDMTPDPRCAPPTPPPGLFVSGDDPNPSTPNFPVKLFELDATNSVIGEIPCLAPCDVAGTTFRFAVPPRAVDPVILKPFRRFVAMTMIGQVKQLWPSVGGNPTAPFLDTTILGTRFTGLLGPTVTGCRQADLACGGPTGEDCTCTKLTTFRQYRVLTHAKLTFGNDTKSTYKTAATAQLTPTQPTPLPQQQTRPAADAWETLEGPLP
jgi:hypothetical protein